jgi:hypothetical protein
MCAERVYLIPPPSTTTTASASSATVPDISILIKEWLAELSKKHQTEVEHLLKKLRKSEIRWNEDGQVIYPNSEEIPGSHITRLLDWILKKQIKIKPIDIDLFLKYLKKNDVSGTSVETNLKFPDNWIYLY